MTSTVVRDGWKVVAIKYLVTCNDDVLPETTEPGRRLSYVDIGNVAPGVGITGCEVVTFADAPSRARRRVRHGDVIVSTVRTYLRAIATIQEPNDDVVVSTGFAVLRPGPCLSSRFFGYAMQSESVINEIVSRSTGVGYPAISASDLVRIALPIPDVARQERIADFLDRETAEADALVAKYERLIELLEEKRVAMITQAVTKGLDPSVPMKGSGVPWIGDVPSHWDVTPLKYLVEVTSGSTPSKERPDYWNGDIPWASAKDLKTDSIADTEDHVTSVAAAECGLRILPPHTILTVVRGMILARYLPVAITERPMIINQDLKALRPRHNVETSYLANYLRSKSSTIISFADAAAHGTKVLRSEDWMNLPVPVPPLTEQREIVHDISVCAGRLNDAKRTVSRAITLVNEHRAALITAAVTGQIDVTNYRSMKRSIEVPA